MAPGISTGLETNFLLEKTSSPDNTQFSGKDFIRTWLPGEAVVLLRWWRAMPSQWHWFILNVTALKCHQLGVPLDTLCVNQLSLVGFSGTTVIWTNCKSTPLFWAFIPPGRGEERANPAEPRKVFAASHSSCSVWEQLHCCSQQSEPQREAQPGPAALPEPLSQRRLVTQQGNPPAGRDHC